MTESARSWYARGRSWYRAPMRSLVCIAALSAAGLAACSSSTSPFSGPYTTCAYGYAVTNESGKEIGEPCTSGDECRYGVCIQPDDPYNDVNDAFGFCSRGCDCNDDPASRLPDEWDGVYLCRYTTGDQGSHRMVQIECRNDGDCQAHGWTRCSGAISGTARRVCLAGSYAQ